MVINIMLISKILVSFDRSQRDLQNDAKIVSRTSKLSQNDDPSSLTGDKNQQYPITNHVTQKKTIYIYIYIYILNNAPLISILEILQILLILSVCKSAVNCLPEGPAAGAKP